MGKLSIDITRRIGALLLIFLFLIPLHLIHKLIEFLETNGIKLGYKIIGEVE